jgi:glycosyltransferase involved in cell wall biosynthesis
MLSESGHIISVGCNYNPPKGGIAQVVYTYSRYIFSPFKYVANSGDGLLIFKLGKLLNALLVFFFKLLFDYKIKIVHIHTASNISFKRSALFVRIANLFHKKVVLHVHGGAFRDYYHREAHYVTSVLNRCDCVIALSETWKKFFEGICDTPVVVLNNIIEPPQQEICKKDGRVHLLFLGLLVKEKGIYDLLNMISEHADFFRGRIVLHIGGNGDADILKNTIKQKRISDFVCYEGWVSGHKKTRLFSLCDIYVLPSYIEGMPISILEAMSYGCSILATNVGGIPEIIQDGVNGFLFQAGNKEEMYSKLRKLVVDDNMRMEMGQIGLSKSHAYLPDAVGMDLTSIYRRLLETKTK